MTGRDQRESGAATLDEALRDAFAEEGVISYDSKQRLLRADRRACPFRSLRLIIGQECLTGFSDISDMDITEPFTVFPGVFLVTISSGGSEREEREEREKRLLFIPRRHYHPPEPDHPYAHVLPLRDTDIPPDGPFYTWMIPLLKVPERSGAYDVVEKTVDFFNFLASVGTHPEDTDPNADFFDDRRDIFGMFSEVMRFLDDPFEWYPHGIFFEYYFDVAAVSCRGVVDNFLSNLNNVSDARVRQSASDFATHTFQVRLVSASSNRASYFMIVINCRTLANPNSISISMVHGWLLFNNSNNDVIEDAMSNAASPQNEDGDAGGAVAAGPGVASAGGYLRRDPLGALGAVLDELQRSVARL